MERYFRRIDWLGPRETDEREILAVQFALVQEEDGHKATAAILDLVCYDEEGEENGIKWDTARLYIKPELIGIDGVKSSVKEGQGLEPQEATAILGIWDNLIKVLEHWAVGTYLVEYWQYFSDTKTAKVARRNLDGNEIIKSIEFERKIYDALDKSGYNVKLAGISKECQLRLRQWP